MSEFNWTPEPNPDDRRPVLYLPSGRNNPSFLIWALRPEARITVPLKAAFTRVIVELHFAWLEDAGLEIPARGWRRPERLAEAIALTTGYEVEAQTIRAYLSQTQRLIREVVREVGRDIPVPNLFEHKRGLGARLAVAGLQFIGERPD